MPADTSGLTLRRVQIGEILPLRARLLRSGKPEETARFNEDELPDTLHFGAFLDEVPVGCLTLLHNPGRKPPTWQLRGMGTEFSYQKMGIGRALLAFAEEDRLHNYGAIRIWCNARIHAVPFYLKSGYSITSKEFEIPGIGKHYRMEKTRT